MYHKLGAVSEQALANGFRDIEQNVNGDEQCLVSHLASRLPDLNNL